MKTAAGFVVLVAGLAVVSWFGRWLSGSLFFRPGEFPAQASPWSWVLGLLIGALVIALGGFGLVMISFGVYDISKQIGIKLFPNLSMPKTKAPELAQLSRNTKTASPDRILEHIP